MRPLSPALTPLVEFLLFGSQAMFLQTWRDWLLAPFRKWRARRRRHTRKPRRRETPASSPTPATTDEEKDEGPTSFYLYPDPITPARSRRSTILAPARAVDDDDFDDGASDTTPRFVHQDMEDEDELEWSSDDEFDVKHRARRQARARARRLPRQSRLFQWERPVQWDAVRVGAVGPPSITVSRASEERIDEVDEEDIGNVLTDVHEEIEMDVADASSRYQQHRPRLQVVTNTSSSAALTIKSMSSSISATSTTPLRPGRTKNPSGAVPPPRLPRDSRNSSPTFAYPVASSSFPRSPSGASLPRSPSGASLTRITTGGSLTDASGRPMDFMYGEMHIFMGIVGLPRPRAVEMHAAARIRPDGTPRVGRRPRRRDDVQNATLRPAADEDNDVWRPDDHDADDAAFRRSTSQKSSRRRSRPRMFTFDDDDAPASLSTVDETLVELPPLRLHQHEPELGTLREHN